MLPIRQALILLSFSYLTERLAPQGNQPGEAEPGTKCELRQNASNTNPRVCPGYLPGDPSNNGNKQLIGDWLSNLDGSAGNWNSRAEALRQTTVAGVTVNHVAQSITRPRSYALRELKDRGIVVARLQASANSGKIDKRYNVGGAKTKDMKNSFFFVISDVDFPVAFPTTSSYPVGRWTLYGIDNAGKIAEVSRGKLHYCSPNATHPAGGTSIRFTGCADAHRVSQMEAQPAVTRILHGRTLSKAWTTDRASLTKAFGASAAQMVRILDSEDIAPVWVMCGVGCCTMES